MCLFVDYAIICLFQLKLNIPGGSNGHVGTLSPFYGTFTQHKDVTTLKMCFINYYNHPSKPIRLISICIDCLTKILFLGRLTSIQMIGQ